MVSSLHVNDRLAEYLDGTLSTAAYNKVKSHLVFCNSCRHAHQEMKKMTDLLRTTPLAMPSKSLEEKIISTISQNASPSDEQINQTENKKTLFLSFRGIGFVAAGLLLVFFIQNTSKTLRDNPKAKIIKSETSNSAKPPAQTGQRPLQDSRKTGVGDVAALSTQSREPSKLTEVKVENTTPKSTLKSAATAAPNEPKTSKVFDNEIISGDSSSIYEPLELVITNQESWDEYWNKHQKELPQKSPPPTVNFQFNDVILVFAGTQPSGGYRVEITRILVTQWENAPARVIQYRINKPPKDAMVTMALTQPFLMKLTPKRPGPSFFKKIR